MAWCSRKGKQTFQAAPQTAAIEEAQVRHWLESEGKSISHVETRREHGRVLITVHYTFRVWINFDDEED
jgi:hypothetical protein